MMRHSLTAASIRCAPTLEAAVDVCLHESPATELSVAGFYFVLSEAQSTLAPHCVPWHRSPWQVWCSAGEDMF